MDHPPPVAPAAHHFPLLAHSGPTRAQWWELAIEGCALSNSKRTCHRIRHPNSRDQPTNLRVQRRPSLARSLAFRPNTQTSDATLTRCSTLAYQFERSKPAILEQESRSAALNFRLGEVVCCESGGLLGASGLLLQPLLYLHYSFSGLLGTTDLKRPR